MHLKSFNLTLDSQPTKEDEWEGVCSAQEDVKMIKISRKFPKSWPPTIYKHPKRMKPAQLLPAQGDQTRRSDRPNAAPTSGHYTPSPRMAAMCPSLNIVR
jgi:hypothetical protein